MAQARDILKSKGTQVLSIGSDATVLDAAFLMNEHKIGALVVTRAGYVEGIVTERDVLRRVVAERRDPADVRVSQAMTREVLCCGPDTDLAEVAGVMMHHRVRHMPVVDERRRLMGILSLGDLNAHRVDTQAATIQYLEAYLYGQS